MKFNPFTMKANLRELPILGDNKYSLLALILKKSDKF